MSVCIEILYFLVMLLALPVYVVFALLRCVREPDRFQPLKQRLGFALHARPGAACYDAAGSQTERKHADRQTAPELASSEGCRRVWIHAVSVGEIAASVSVIRELVKKQNCQIIVSCTTATGYKMARKKLPDDVQLVYAPLDLPWIVKRFLKQLKPDVLAIAEIELWPFLIGKAAQAGIPVLLFNGRMPEQERRSYRLIHAYMKKLFTKMVWVGTQDGNYRDAYIDIGARPEQVVSAGNIKFDFEPVLSSSKVAEECRLPQDVAFLCLASTHRGEEKAILTALRGKLDFGRWRILLVPRHPHRGREVLALARSLDYSAELRSRKRPFREDILIVDTIGELVEVYNLSALAVIGGSFSKKVQGHNPLEAVALKKPVVFGPCMGNFSSVARILLENDGALQVADASDLENLPEMSREQRERLAQKGYEAFQKNRGASALYAEKILDFC